MHSMVVDRRLSAETARCFLMADDSFGRVGSDDDGGKLTCSMKPNGDLQQSLHAVYCLCPREPERRTDDWKRLLKWRLKNEGKRKRQENR